MNKTFDDILIGKDLEALVSETSIPLNVLVTIKIRIEKCLHSETTEADLVRLRASLPIHFPKYFPDEEKPT